MKTFSLLVSIVSFIMLISFIGRGILLGQNVKAYININKLSMVERVKFMWRIVFFIDNSPTIVEYRKRWYLNFLLIIITMLLTAVTSSYSGYL
jgi:hypothetical protein